MEFVKQSRDAIECTSVVWSPYFIIIFAWSRPLSTSDTPGFPKISPGFDTLGIIDFGLATGSTPLISHSPLEINPAATKNHTGRSTTGVKTGPRETLKCQFRRPELAK